MNLVITPKVVCRYGKVRDCCDTGAPLAAVGLPLMSAGWAAVILWKAPNPKSPLIKIHSDVWPVSNFLSCCILNEEGT